MSKSGLRVNQEEYEALVSEIYQCSLNPQLWNKVLVGIGKPIDCHLGQLVCCQNNTYAGYANSSSGLQKEAIDEFERHIGEGVQPRVNVASRMPAMTTLTDAHFINQKEMRRHFYYCTSGRKFDAYYSVFTILSNSQSGFSGVGCFRSEKQGAVNKEEFEYFQKISAHIRKSVDLMFLSRLRYFTSELSSSLENFSAALVIIGVKGLICGMNKHAEEILARNDGISHKDGKLIVADSFSANHLDAEMSAMFYRKDFVKDGSGKTLLVKRSDKKNPYQVLAVPLCGRENILSGLAGILCILDPDKLKARYKDYFRQKYALSKTEAELLCSLCHGGSLQEFAVCRHISIATARTHLKNLFLKTNTNRQTQLIAQTLSAYREEQQLISLLQ